MNRPSDAGQRLRVAQEERRFVIALKDIRRLVYNLYRRPGADPVHEESHEKRHQAGKQDAQLGVLDANARVLVRRNSTGDPGEGPRRRINLIEGANITLTIVDDPDNEEIDVTITGAAGGAAGSISKQWANAVGVR